MSLSVFQFTRARGARRKGGVLRANDEGFNSRAHGARDGYLSRIQHRQTGFNSRAHGARDPRPAPNPKTAKFQFTRARGARHLAPAIHGVVGRVSIHARTGRATSRRT